MKSSALTQWNKEFLTQEFQEPDRPLRYKQLSTLNSLLCAKANPALPRDPHASALAQAHWHHHQPHTWPMTSKGEHTFHRNMRWS